MSERIVKEQPLKKPTKGSIEEIIRETESELLVIKQLKEAIKNYLLIDDYTDYSLEDAMPAFYLILGRLEMSIARRELMLKGEQKELLEFI